VRPPVAGRVDLASLAARLSAVATIDATSMMLNLSLHERPELLLTVFGDGRMIVFGTTDPQVARSIYARVIG
jgi:adenylyltransferase/sulfurtransferase